VIDRRKVFGALMDVKMYWPKEVGYQALDIIKDAVEQALKLERGDEARRTVSGQEAVAWIAPVELEHLQKGYRNSAVVCRGGGAYTMPLYAASIPATEQNDAEQ
jgi:hypothetical protein